MPSLPTEADLACLREALRLARRGYGTTSPNPMVGALLVQAGQVIGRGWHRRAGQPHAEIEALRDAQRRGHSVEGATLYVTLEPCCTQGRTPPCTAAIIAAGIRKVVVGATDPNPRHSGRAFAILAQAGVATVQSGLAEECTALNAAFNHWICHRTPFVTVKAAMTLDGKIATASGQSKWITGERARGYGMRLRLGADAILVGINTILADNPSLTVRPFGSATPTSRTRVSESHRLRRIVLDAMARTPLAAKVVSDAAADLTAVVVSQNAPPRRVAALQRRVRVLVAPALAEEPIGRGNERMKPGLTAPGGGDGWHSRGDPPHQICGAEPSPARARNAAGGRHRSQRIDLPWLLRQLGSEDVTSLLVEGGGEVNASFLLGGFAHRVAFFYAPKILGGRDSLRAVAGAGAECLTEARTLTGVRWRKLGPDWLLTAAVG